MVYELYGHPLSSIQHPLEDPGTGIALSISALMLHSIGSGEGMQLPEKVVVECLNYDMAADATVLRGIPYVDKPAVLFQFSARMELSMPMVQRWHLQ